MFKWRQVMITKPLSDMREGEKGIIMSIRGKPMMHRYLCENGLMVGCNIAVTKVETTPLEPVVTLKTGDRSFTLGIKTAYNIRVDVPLDILEKENLNLKKEFVRV
jgi:Fe2+ transport system protein FeoA